MPLLIAMRHAKAVDRMQAEDDFDRGLTERGVSDADRAARRPKPNNRPPKPRSMRHRSLQRHLAGTPNP